MYNIHDIDIFDIDILQYVVFTSYLSDDEGLMGLWGVENGEGRGGVCNVKMPQ